MKKQAFYHGVVDDTSPVYSSQNVDLIETVINHDLHELNSRSSKWLMSHKPQHYILWFVLVMLLRTYIFFIALNLRKITRLFLYLPFVNISDLSFSKMLNEMNIQEKKLTNITTKTLASFTKRGDLSVTCGRQVVFSGFFHQ